MSPEIESDEMALCAQAWESYVQQEGGKDLGFGARQAFRAAWFMYAQHRMAAMPSASALPVGELRREPGNSSFTFHANERTIQLGFGDYWLYAARKTR